MKTVIITNNSIKFYGGSELITLDLCDYFVAKGYNVYLCAMEIDNPLAKHLNPKVTRINLKKQQIPIRQVDLIVGHHHNVIDKVLEQVKCNTIIQNSLSPFSGVEDYSKNATKLLVHSQATKAIRQNQVSKPIEVFVNSCSDEFMCKEKHLNSKISKIAIISNHQWHKDLKKPNVDKIGSFNSKYVNADLLLQYDVVITIGRTVQECLCLGIPVYCYDHFGGPGYITKENIDFNEHYNFTGRSKPNDYTDVKEHNFEKIFADIYNNYDTICKQQAELRRIARERYNLSKNIEKVLKEIINE